MTNRPPDSSFAAHEQPLELTIHALPPLSRPHTQTPATWAGRWKMLAVLLVCASPVVASYFTYYIVRPEGRRNFGELIAPQRPLPALTTRTLDGEPGQLTILKGQWLLLSVAGGVCDERCEQNLYFQRQLRESLGREKERLDWVWLVDDETPVREALRPALASATVLRVAPDALARWLAPAPGHLLPDHLYLVDPMGNLMMRFPANMDMAAAARARRDLDRLLRASSSWDREGRAP